MRAVKRLIFLILFISPAISFAQHEDSLLQPADLQKCISYALEHYPGLKESEIDEDILRHEIRYRLADWYPQISLDYSFQHNFELQKSFFGGTTTTIGVKNTSGVFISATQNIFNRDALLASRTAQEVRTQGRELTENSRIYVILYTGKAFYDVLLTQEQVFLIEEDITRLSRTLKDAYNQYKAGVVDKTDYERAQISLNNSVAQKKAYQQSLAASFALLKQNMGYPSYASLNLVYDSLQLEHEIYFDTLQQVNYTNRIEYKLLQTEQRLLQANVTYARWDFLPQISAYGAYNLNFSNDNFGKLYGQNFPNSYAGLTISFPLFEGGKRIEEIKIANLQLEKTKYNFKALQDSIDAEYAVALANYKSNLAGFLTMKENLALAQDVYNTIYLQYKEGVKQYLDVIIAETDLRSTQVNYLNALYEALSSKLDAEKALGTLSSSP